MAGTIGATFGNGLGIDGVNPFARLVVAEHSALASLQMIAPEQLGSAEEDIFAQRQSMGLEMMFGLFGLLEQAPFVQVVNVSLGYNW